MLRRPVGTSIYNVRTARRAGQAAVLPWTTVRYYSSPTNYYCYLNFRTVSPIQKVYLQYDFDYQSIQQYIHSTLVVIHSPLSPLHMEYYVYFHVMMM